MDLLLSLLIYQRVMTKDKNVCLKNETDQIVFLVGLSYDIWVMLSKLEYHREGVCYRNRTVSLLSRFPLR